MRTIWRSLCLVVGCVGLVGLLYADDGVEFKSKSQDSPDQSTASSSSSTPKPRPPKPKAEAEAHGVEFKGDDSKDEPALTDQLPFVSTGETAPEFEPLDALFKRMVTEQQVPGVSVAVAKDGRLVYARGFGYADVEQKQPAQPDSFYRVASLSKALTSTGIFKLVDQGRITLDQPVFDLLEIEPYLKEGAQLDPRMKEITIRQCLQHTAGWDRDATYDPLFRPVWICEQMNKRPPLTSTELLSFQFGRTLDFDPGQKYRYSNLGYTVLGRVIEKVSGMSYEDFMKKEIFEPLGMQDIRIGKELAEERAEREVVYYTPKPWNTECAVEPRVGEQVICQYGAWDMRVMDSAAGWTTTAIELAKFASTYYGDTHPILSAEAVKEMFGPPAKPIGHDDDGNPEKSYYACAWQVRNYDDGTFTASHTGLFKPGTSTLMVRRNDGIVFVVLCNQDVTKDKSLPSSWIDGKMHKAIDQVQSWPEKNLFITENAPADLTPTSP